MISDFIFYMNFNPHQTVALSHPNLWKGCIVWYFRNIFCHWNSRGTIISSSVAFNTNQINYRIFLHYWFNILFLSIMLSLQREVSKLSTSILIACTSTVIWILLNFTRLGLMKLFKHLESVSHRLLIVSKLLDISTGFYDRLEVCGCLPTTARSVIRGYNTET